MHCYYVGYTMLLGWIKGHFGTVSCGTHAHMPMEDVEPVCSCEKDDKVNGGRLH